MELTIVGCSGSTSGPDNPASCYLLTHDGYSLVLDLGPGSFGALMKYADPRRIDAIALSHLHPDHCLDLCAFNVAARYSGQLNWPVIPVLGPAYTRARMSAAYEPEPAEVTEWNFEFYTWQDSQQVGPFLIETTKVCHSTEAYAVRVTAGERSITYSGDTGPTEKLIRLAYDTDLLLCEAAFYHADDLPRGVHLSGQQAAEHATCADAKRLMLTHIPPWLDAERVYDEARPHFAGDLLLAEPGLTLSLD